MTLRPSRKRCEHIIANYIHHSIDWSRYRLIAPSLQFRSPGSALWIRLVRALASNKTSAHFFSEERVHFIWHPDPIPEMREFYKQAKENFDRSSG
jgi:hypothetical protein